MDISKNINGERWSLSQNDSNQITIMKNKETVSVQNLDYKLGIKEGFDILSKAPGMKFHRYIPEETELKEIPVEQPKPVVPKPHICVFCNTEPKVITLTGTSSSPTASETRALRCGCLAKSDGSSTVAYKRWVYTVDVINNNVDEADTKLINEWNRRMPIIGEKR